MKPYLFEKGDALPLGSDPRSGGVNFSVFSEHAERIELCLFDDLGQQEIQRIPMVRAENYIWHIFVEGVSVGAKYGFRAHGPFEPEKGQRFNANQVLIDPYARNLDRSFYWSSQHFAYEKKDALKDMSLSSKSNAAIVPKSIVCAKKTSVEIQDIQSRKPNVSWQDTIIYEAHVRGITQLNLELPSDKRGTLLGLADSSTLEYLTALGITAIELLPIHSFIDEEFLTQQGLSNYWGYNTLNFFTPHLGYLKSADPNEFLVTVEALHAAGIEVILDVVYNHTAESNHYGPTLSFRGLDNKSYYRLEAGKPRHYVNDTGCGNTVRSDHPRVMHMIMDSLRYWAAEMGVDGFRFDLASILGRDEKGFSSHAAFFQAISQDPLLSRCKMIAEPWDIGPGGYQLGAYPGEWSEWNDKYRDVCRRFWAGDEGVMPEFARRIHGSNDLFESAGRGPRASVNFICSHDGFTLADMVSYQEKNNVANKENNRDGHHTNFSANYGTEGQTDNEEILKIRRRQQRNLMATLFLSQGTPMLLAGDELGRSQLGNNNAYCQDNEINWIAWAHLQKNHSALRDFTAKVIKIRKSYDILRSPAYIHNPEDLDKEKRCARWVSPKGAAMKDEDWHRGDQNALGWILESLQGNQKEIVLILFNASASELSFTLPNEQDVLSWRLILDTWHENGLPENSSFSSHAVIHMQERTTKVLIAQFDPGISG